MYAESWSNGPELEETDDACDHCATALYSADRKEYINGVLQCGTCYDQAMAAEPEGDCD